jgi:thiamine-phosphate pyrophosphorylase
MQPAWFTRSRLWLVLDERAAAPRSMLEAARLGLEGGADVVVFRHRHAPLQEVLDLGKPIRELCRNRATPFVLSHYPELARHLAPDAVNLGSADPPLSEVRRTVGRNLPLGFSAHSPAEARERLAEGFAYCVLGPVYPTPEKLKYGPPLGLDAVRATADLAPQLVYIGGIAAGNVGAILALGAQRVGVISAIQSAADPAAAARLLRQQLDSTERGAPGRNVDETG